jgi:hypothetical protein
MIDLEHEVKRLKRGLMTGNDRTALDAYKTLFKAGVPAVPLISAELEKFDFKKPLPKEAANLLAGLVALQRDLDEVRSNSFIDDNVSGDSTQLAASILRSARRMRHQDFRASKFGDIVILEHTSIGQGYTASGNVRTWLSQVPPEDLLGISRIYILPHDLKMDWLGHYTPILGVVTIAWTTIVPPLRSINLLTNNLHRHTLLHEIGHHALKHWFGQHPEQEAEAESYARHAKYRRRPVWARCAAAIFATLSRRS